MIVMKVVSQKISKVLTRMVVKSWQTMWLAPRMNFMSPDRYPTDHINPFQSQAPPHMTHFRRVKFRNHLPTNLAIVIRMATKKNLEIRPFLLRPITLRSTALYLEKITIRVQSPTDPPAVTVSHSE